MATVGTNLAHGIGHSPVGALVSAWPALALVGSFELLMMLIGSQRPDATGGSVNTPPSHPVPALVQDPPPELPSPLSLEQTVRVWHKAGQSQRAIAREFNLDRRKVKQIIERKTA